MATDTPLPAGLVALRNYESNYLESKDQKWLLSDLMVYYVGLRDVIRRGQLNDRKTIESLLGLDSEFVNLAVAAPEAWQYQKVLVDAPSERVFGKHLDVYLDHHITQTWNVSRLVRILLNEMLRDYSSTPAGVGYAYKEGSSLRIQTELTISTLVTEICASVPQYTCPDITRHFSMSPSSETTAASRSDDSSNFHTGTRIYTPAEKVRAYTLIFPLFVAGQSIRATTEQKLWIISQLHFMAGEMCIRNAEVVAKILEAGDYLNPWKVYALLGSYAFAA